MMRIPRRGTVNTTAWYCEYHGVVLRIPRCGTVNTTVWYCEYQTVAFFWYAAPFAVEFNRKIPQGF